VSDEPVSRAEYDELARRVRALEDNFDAHRTVIIAGLHRLERRVDDGFAAMDERLDTVTETLGHNTTLLRSIAPQLGIDE
jgi:hypothetical protein